MKYRHADHRNADNHLTSAILKMKKTTGVTIERNLRPRSLPRTGNAHLRDYNCASVLTKKSRRVYMPPSLSAGSIRSRGTRFIPMTCIRSVKPALCHRLPLYHIVYSRARSKETMIFHEHFDFPWIL